MRIFEFSDNNNTVVVSKCIVAFDKKEMMDDSFAIGVLTNTPNNNTLLLHYDDKETRDQDYDTLVCEIADTNYTTGD